MIKVTVEWAPSPLFFYEFRNFMRTRKLILQKQGICMAKEKITELVAGVLSEFLDENGYELYYTEFTKEGRDWFLRVYIELKGTDNKSGQDNQYVSTDDCEKVSRFLSEKLDEADPIEQNYYLEVSSPGMDRPLIKPKHYERYLGHEIEVKLYRGIDGVKNIQGILRDFERDDGDYTVLLIDQDEKEWNLKLSEIAKAKLAVIF